MAERGSTGNIIAAVASFFFPGLGQLAQGRLLPAAGFFVASLLLWVVTFGLLGWVMHLWACIDAALYDDGLR